MASLTINPQDVIDYKTPLYRQEDNNTVMRLLPETTADQVKTPTGGDVATELSSIKSDLINTANVAATGLSNANAAITAAGEASSIAVAAQQTANAAQQAGSTKVNKTGDTMSGDLTIEKSSPTFFGKTPDLDITDTSFSQTKCGAKFQTLDKDGEILSSCDYAVFATGNVMNRFRLRRRIDGDIVEEDAGLVMKSDGGSWFKIPMPPLTSNDQYAAITALWANSKFLPLVGGTINGSIQFESTYNEFIGITKETLDASETNPSENKFVQINIKDKNGILIGNLQFSQYTSGNFTSGLLAHAYTQGHEGELAYRHQAAITVGVNKEGNSFTQAPTPWFGSNGDYIATTKWVNQKLGAGASTVALSSLNEIDENYVETLETKKLKAIAQINSGAQQAIYMGFSYEINAQEYIIGYSLIDQFNLNSDALIAMQNPGKLMPFRCMDETGQAVWLDIPTETILAIQKYGITQHRDIIRRAADEKKERIMAAINDTQIQTIMAE